MFDIRTFLHVIPPMMGFMIMGIGNALVTKWCFVEEAVGNDGVTKQFVKPWYVTSLTFVGMATATIIYFIMQIKYPELLKIQDLSFKDFCEFIAPALSDSFEGIVSAVCIVFVGNSYDSMMKAGTLVGCSLVARFVFKRYYRPHQWWSVIVVIVSLTMVGVAGVLNSDTETVTTPAVWVAVIMILKLVSQVGYAVKLSYEEYFQKEKHYHPVMVCGLEGCWSSFLCVFVCMPIAQYLPGEEGNGIREDSIETFKMLGSNKILILASFVVWGLGLCYNVTSNYLIKATSSVVRSLMESVRTFLIWVVSFAFFYGFNSLPDGHSQKKYSALGEEWGVGSYMQLAGFIFMTFGILEYNGFPKFPCWKYESDDSQSQVIELDKTEVEDPDLKAKADV